MPQLNPDIENNIKLIEQLAKIAKTLAPVNPLPSALLSINQISELYNIHRDILRSAIDSGELKARRTGKSLSSKFVCRQKDVENYLENVFDDDFVEDSQFFNHLAIRKRFKKV